MALRIAPSRRTVANSACAIADGGAIRSAPPVGRAATSDRGAASGLYLASYFFGGLIGSAVLGTLFDMFGWAACVGAVAAALIVAALLAVFLRTPMAPEGLAH